MVGYRRNKPGNPDDIFFLVIVTRNRRPWIAEFGCYDFLLAQMKRATREFGVRFEAWVILPDHVHWLIKPGKADYSRVVSAFKRWISWSFKRRGLIRKGEKLWQDRFWEETMRDGDHYQRCVEYIHYNPVKHGLAGTPRDWRYSSFHGYVEKGLYPYDWACDENMEIYESEYD